MLKDLIKGAMDIIFPRNCLLCRCYHPMTGRNPLCPNCFKKIPWNKKPLGINTATAIHYDEAWSLLYYSASTPTLLKQFKFHNKTSLRHTSAHIFNAFIKHNAPNIPPHAVITPMPLHPARLRERGYNQSALIAQGIADILKLPLYENIIARHRPTAHQSQLHAKDRWTNVDGAFRIMPLADIVGKDIILVDDILTTGATASEAAKTLKEAGASRVIVITLAIVPCGSCTTTS
jgi:ComF family protein